MKIADTVMIKKANIVRLKRQEDKACSKTRVNLGSALTGGIFYKQYMKVCCLKSVLKVDLTLQNLFSICIFASIRQGKLHACENLLDSFLLKYNQVV